MITTTARALITSTFKLIGVLGAEETPSAVMEQDALAALNALIDGWGTARQTMQSVARYEFPLVANQQTYTIGDGGDFDLEPPLTLDHVGLLFPDTDPAIEVPIPLLTDDQYAALQVKALPNTLINVAYYSRPSAAIATLFVWAAPTQAQTIVLYVPLTLAQFSNATEDVTLSAGYYDALRYNLAVRLYPEYGVAPREDVNQQAREALASLKRANFRLSDLSFDLALVGRASYNIYSDSP